MKKVKIGRNDPCPCGSGKKYKKCCMNKSDVANQVKYQRLDSGWTLNRIKRLTTKELLEILQTAGIDINENGFVKEIKRAPSAKELLDQWIKKFNLEQGKQKSDSIYFSIRVLAERLSPNHVLAEDLQDLMQVGYDSGSPYPDEYGIFVWWKLWKELQKWIVDKKISSVEQLDETTDEIMSKPFSSWVIDFDYALNQAGKENNEFVPMRHVFAEDFLNCFPHSDESLKEQILMSREDTVSY